MYCTFINLFTYPIFFVRQIKADDNLIFILQSLKDEMKKSALRMIQTYLTQKAIFPTSRLKKSKNVLKMNACAKKAGVIR